MTRRRTASTTFGSLSSSTPSSNVAFALSLTISQTLPFPTAIASQAKLASAHIAGAEAQLIMTKNELVKNVRSTYQQLIYSMAVHSELMAQDSLLFSFAKAAATRHRVGEGTLLEKSAADLRAKEVRNQLIQNEADISILKRQLQTLINSADEFVPSDAIGRLTPSLEAATADASPLLGILQQDVAIADRSKRVERNKLLPDIMVGYFTQSLIGFQRINNNDVFFDKNDRFTGFEFGVSFPLWFAPQLGKAKAAALNQESSLNKYQFFQKQIESDLQKAQLELAKYDNSLKFYEGDAIINAELILHQAQRAYAEGEIGYVELFQAINQARIIKLEYLKTLSQYNQASIELDYLIGKF